MNRSIIAATFFVVACLCGGRVVYLAAEETPKTDSRFPFRTEFANAHLPWYQPKALEFPPFHSERRVGGELVTADFIHRTGQFRTNETGELIDFTLPPYGTINYLNAEADLRDVPLGTNFLFFLHQDAQGAFTRVAAMEHQFTTDEEYGVSYRLDELKLSERKLIVTKRNIRRGWRALGTKELLITNETRVWKGEKGDKPAQLTDLSVGDDLFFNLTGQSVSKPGYCTDIWIGVEKQSFIAEQQRKKHAAFVKFRGLPGWVDRTEGNKLTITLFSGDPEKFKQAWMNDFKVGREANVVVANDELRTWNPPVDKERGTLVEIQEVPIDCFGCSGVRLVVTVPNMLEGFRKGRVVRVFGAGWPMKDQPYGESLMGYGYGRLQNAEVMEITPKEYPAQFPFRTDYGNLHLPWYQLQTDVTPPPYSEHLMFGELIQFTTSQRSGQFRSDRSGKTESFSLIPSGTIRFLNATAELADIPLGTRCRFHMYQDERGEFTRASLVTDEYSYLTAIAATYRVEAVQIDGSDATQAKIHVARQMPLVKNYNGDMEQPQDIARTELRVNADTRCWKGDQRVKLSDLAVGDVLLVNLTGETPGSPSRCTDIWIGPDTHKLVTDQQAKKYATAKNAKK